MQGPRDLASPLPLPRSPPAALPYFSSVSRLSSLSVPYCSLSHLVIPAQGLCSRHFPNPTLLPQTSTALSTCYPVLLLIHFSFLPSPPDLPQTLFHGSPVCSATMPTPQQWTLRPFHRRSPNTHKGTAHYCVTNMC